MEIKPCKKCLDYNICIKDSEFPDDPPALKERMYNIFVEGYDCFCGKPNFE